jgi:hypothetical protein
MAALAPARPGAAACCPSATHPSLPVAARPRPGPLRGGARPCPSPSPRCGARPRPCFPRGGAAARPCPSRGSAARPPPCSLPRGGPAPDAAALPPGAASPAPGVAFLAPRRAAPARGLGPLRVAFGPCARHPGPRAARVASVRLAWPFYPLTRSRMRNPTRAVIILGL